MIIYLILPTHSVQNNYLKIQDVFFLFFEKFMKSCRKKSALSFFAALNSLGGYTNVKHHPDKESIEITTTPNTKYRIRFFSTGDLRLAKTVHISTECVFFYILTQDYATKVAQLLTVDQENIQKKTSQNSLITSTRLCCGDS